VTEPRREKTVRISEVAWRLIRESAVHHDLSIGRVIEHLAFALKPPPPRRIPPLPAEVELTVVDDPKDPTP